MDKDIAEIICACFNLLRIVDLCPVNMLAMMLTVDVVDVE
jgi:hypothetical protein